MGTAPDALLSLVERFANHVDYYCSGQYKEIDLRNEFLDPFFEALGWDVYNKRDYDPSHRQVVRETRLRVEGTSRAPDYSFRTGSQPEFFVEAKHPGHNLDKDPKPAHQLRRYARGAGLAVSILTDFDEFCVYNAKLRPRETDKPYTGRIRYLRYTDYPAEWQWLLDNFSPEAVQRGSLFALAGEKGMRTGTAPAGDDFLKDIERWRKLLARNIALRNKGIKELVDLNYVVQATIDRIVFVRICEDRGIETGDQLKSLLGNDGIYRSLFQRFQEADERYNSGLFYFTREKTRRERVDEISARLKIDDAPLKEIISGLYPPKSSCEFSVMPADVLGQVYERFLGSVIRLTEGHQAKIEPKPEVRKAGGVYYTPTYIVDYIVKSTVGKLLEGKTPKDALKLHILDPACGSGSFLIGAYQYLLDWFRDWYFRDGPEKHHDVLYKAGEDDWRLFSKARKDILTNCIYGVDIDRQAVEVTKLSLLLKVLEGETAETIRTQLSAFRQRALPDLGNNIKCGNSLIGDDFFAGSQAELFEDKDLRTRINPFDWDDEFPAIINMKSGGFDAVIGNPPYLYSAGKDHTDYFESHYRLSQYQTDFYVYFLEKALSLARTGGKVSYIVPDSWLNSDYYSALRTCLLSEHRLDRLAVFDYPVFAKVTLENSVLVVSVRTRPAAFPVVRFREPNSFEETNVIDPGAAVSRGIIDPRCSQASERVLAKIETGSVPLGDIARVNRGIHAYRTDGYGISRFARGPQTKKDKEERSYHARRRLNDTYLPELKGKDVFRFSFTPTGDYLSYGPWLAEPREPAFFHKPKLALRKILGPKLHGTYIEKPYALDQSLYIVITKDRDVSTLKFILAVTLSRLGAWYLRTKYAIYDSLYPWYTKKQLAAFPMKHEDARLVGLTDLMLNLHTKLQKAKSQTDKEALRRQIAATDRQIDTLVYELYGLTEDEVRIVDGTN